MKIREIARGLQFPEGPVAMADGSVLLVEIARGTLSRVHARRPGAGRRRSRRRAERRGDRPGRRGLRLQQRRLPLHHRGGRLPCGRSRQADDYSGGRIERVDLATGRFERLFDSVEGLALRGPERHRLRRRRRLLLHRPRQGPRARDRSRRRLLRAARRREPPKVIARPVMTPNGIAPLARRQRRSTTPRPRPRGSGRSTSQAPGEVRREPWPSPHGGRMVVRGAGRPLPALRFDGGRRVRQRLRRDADPRRHQRSSRPTAAHCATSPLPDRYHDQPLLRRRATGAPRSSRCRAAAS